MTGKKQALLRGLAAVPWWVGVGCGLVGYAALWLMLTGSRAEGEPGSGYLVAEGATPALVWLIACIAAVGGGAAVRRREWEQRLAALDGLSREELDGRIGEHFRRLGYSTIEGPCCGPGGGIDLIVHKDGRKYLVECRHWKAPTVRVSVVRDLGGSVVDLGASGGFLVTAGIPTGSARRLARRTGIRLVEGEALARALQREPEREGA